MDRYCLTVFDASTRDFDPRAPRHGHSALRSTGRTGALAARSSCASLLAGDYVGRLFTEGAAESGCVGVQHKSLLRTPERGGEGRNAEVFYSGLNASRVSSPLLPANAGSLLIAPWYPGRSATSRERPRPRNPTKSNAPGCTCRRRAAKLPSRCRSAPGQLFLGLLPHRLTRGARARSGF